MPGLTSAQPFAQEQPTPDAATDRVLADSLYDSGITALLNGDYQGALAHFQEARQIYHNLGEIELEAETLIGIMVVYFTLGDTENALNTQQELIEIAPDAHSAFGAGFGLEDIIEPMQGDSQTTGGGSELSSNDCNPELLQTRDILAYESVLITRYYQGEYQAVLKQYECALTFLQEKETLSIEEMLIKGTLLSNVGAIYANLGQYHRALEHLQLALAEFQTLYNELASDSSLGLFSDSLTYPIQLVEKKTLANIGAVYILQGNYEQGLDYLNQALLISQQLNDYADEALIYSNIGTVYGYLAQYDLALEYFEMALDIRNSIGDDIGAGNTLNNIGAVYLSLKNHDLALEYFESSLQKAEATNHLQGIATAQHNIGEIYHDLGQYENALHYLEKALATEENLGVLALEGTTLYNIGEVYREQEQFDQALIAFQEALQILQEIGYKAGEGAALSNLGTIYERLDDIPQAIYYYQNAIDVFESIQGNLTVSEFVASYAGEHTETYERLVRLLQESGQFEEAFLYTERARARAFLNQLGNQRIDPRAGANPELIIQEQNLANQISALHRQIALGGQLSDGSPVDYASLKAQLEQFQSDYQKLLIELKRSNPSYASLKSIEPLTIDDVRERILDDQTSLITFFVTEDETIAFVLDRENLMVISAPVTQTELEEQVKRLRNLIRVESVSVTGTSDERMDLAADLYQTLIDPLLPYIQHSRLIIVPHKILHYLPFATLLDNNQHYLGTAYTLSTAPSASSLDPELLNLNMNNGHLLSLGNPDTPAKTLPYAEDEAIAVAAHYQQPALFTGTDATEYTLRSNLSGTDVFHFATHGVLDPVNPLFSALLLTSDLSLTMESNSNNDGRLEVREIFNLPLTEANLVVLSACETALGEQTRGDELIGLSRSFFYAGSPVIVASLWPVEDEATGVLMANFHKEFQSGMGPAAALTIAQAVVRHQERWSAPYYWAGFIVIGEGGKETALLPSTPTPTNTPTPLFTSTPNLARTQTVAPIEASTADALSIAELPAPTGTLPSSVSTNLTTEDEQDSIQNRSVLTLIGSGAILFAIILVLAFKLRLTIKKSNNGQSP